ncbi:MAG: DUF1643 domain-containing protein [Clostridia bacterium]|nr:DUF1643 domain-containing protein [Clostridia bacterium]
MHIPRSNTAGIEVLSFEVALSEALCEQAEYDSSRWLYVPCRYDEYRYILGTRGKRPMICIGINPSTASPDKLDPTLKSAERISLYNGYDSFLMFNVYAQRATNPDDMEREYNPWMQSENLKAFEYMLSLCPEPPSVWAAWGAIIEKRDYLSKCVSDLVEIGNRYNAKWYHAGAISKKGHPHHPLYLKSDTVFEPFDVNGYLRTCPCFSK